VVRTAHSAADRSALPAPRTSCCRASAAGTRSQRDMAALRIAARQYGIRDCAVCGEPVYLVERYDPPGVHLTLCTCWKALEAWKEAQRA